MRFNGQSLGSSCSYGTHGTSPVRRDDYQPDGETGCQYAPFTLSIEPYLAAA